MEKEDLTIVIKNIPAKELKLLWGDITQMALSHFNEIVEPSDNIEIEFEDILDMNHFYQAMTFAITQHCMTSAIKIKGTA